MNTSAGTTETQAVVTQEAVEHQLLPIPDDARTSTAAHQFWIWAGANLAPINWVLGALGIGLGLSLAAAVATLHDAKLELSDNGPGLRVTVSYPDSNCAAVIKSSLSAPTCSGSTYAQ